MHPSLAWLMALLLALLPQTAATAENDRALVGAWELVSGEALQDDGSMIHYQRDGMRSLKLISESHFSFTSHKGNAFYAAGSGRYAVRDGHYTETVQYASYAPMLGQEFAFRYEIEGDQLRLSRWRDGVRVEHEIWRRLD